MQIFNKIEISQQIFEKYTSIRCQKFYPVWAELFHVDERNDGHIQDEINSRFTQIYEGACKSIQNPILLRNPIILNISCFQIDFYFN